MEINEGTVADALICWIEALDMDALDQFLSLTLVRLFLGDDPEWQVKLIYKKPGPQKDWFDASKEWERNDEIRAFMQERIDQGEKHEAALTDAIQKFGLSRSNILKRVALSKSSEQYKFESDARAAARLKKIHPNGWRSDSPK
jgi:hypothetical protein